MIQPEIVQNRMQSPSSQFVVLLISLPSLLNNLHISLLTYDLSHKQHYKTAGKLALCDYNQIFVLLVCNDLLSVLYSNIKNKANSGILREAGINIVLF